MAAEVKIEHADKVGGAGASATSGRVGQYQGTQVPWTQLHYLAAFPAAIRNVIVFGMRDAGKTTLAEALMPHVVLPGRDSDGSTLHHSVADLMRTHLTML